MGLNKEELDRFILSEDEVNIKECVWVELNRDYLEALAGENLSFDLAMILLTMILLIQLRVSKIRARRFSGFSNLDSEVPSAI